MVADGANCAALTEPEQWRSVEPEWRELALAAGNPFMTPEWFDAWLGQRAVRPVVVVARGPDARLAGLLPLVMSRAVGVPVVRFAGDELGDRFHPLLRRPEFATEFGEMAGRRIAAATGRLSVYILGHVDPGAPWVAAFRRGLHRSNVALERRRIEAPVIHVGGRSWDGYLADSDRRFRKELRRRRRRVDEEGAVIRAAPPEGVGEATDVLFDLHDRRWRERGGSSLSRDWKRAVIRDFIAASAERGWLRLWLLEIEGRPVAVELAWRLGTRQTHYQSGFDPAFADRGVGGIVFAEAVADAFTTEADEVDLGQGAAAYKLQFSRDLRAATTLVILGRRHPARLPLATALYLRTRHGDAIRRLRGALRGASRA